MTRVLSRLVTLLSLLALVTVAHAVEPTKYMVILVDGSFIQASERPVVEGEIAWIRLPNGLRAHMDPARIDWTRSDRLSSTAQDLFEQTAKNKMVTEQLPQPVKPVQGTITMTSGDEAVSTKVPQAPVPPTPVVDPLSRDIQRQVEDIDRMIENKRYEKKQLEREVEQKKYNLDIVKELRQQIADIEAKIRFAQQQRQQLMKDLRSGS